MMKILCFFFSVLCVVHGTSQFTVCPSSVCLSQPVTYVCSVSDNGDSDTLFWRIRNSTGGVVAADSYGELGTIGSPSMRTIGTHFTIVLTANSNPMISNISFNPVMSISNYTVQCVGGGTTVNCPIVIEGILSNPGTTDSSTSISTHDLSWSSSTSNCFSHYSVPVTVRSTTSLSFTINTTDTTLSLPITSLNSTEYSYNVVAVDIAGRESTLSSFNPFTANVPLPVTGLRYTIPDDQTNSTEVNITVSWNTQSQGSRPIVREYQVIHNVTNSSDETTTTLPVPTSTVILTGATVGSVYTVQVLASNILGNGPATTNVIDVLFASSPTSTSSPISTPTPTITTITDTSVPTTSTTPPPTSSGQPLSGGAIGGIVAAFTSVFVVIVISGVVVYFMYRRNRNGKKTSPQRKETSPEREELQQNYAEVEHGNNNSSKKKSNKSAPPKPAHEPVLYSDVQRSTGPQTEYAELAHAKGSTNRPAPQSGVVYSDVRGQH